MKCAIEIVKLYNFDLSDCEPCGFATTFYGELMDGNHEFTDKKHVKNFIRKVFKGYNFVGFTMAENMLCALIAKAEDYEYYATEGMGYAMHQWYYSEV